MCLGVKIVEVDAHDQIVQLRLTADLQCLGGKHFEQITVSVLELGMQN